jgi:hypothetical protein
VHGSVADYLLDSTWIVPSLFQKDCLKEVVLQPAAQLLFNADRPTLFCSSVYIPRNEKADSFFSIFSQDECSSNIP